MGISFEVENFDEVEDFTLTVREQIPVRTMEGLMEMAQNIVEMARAIAPVKTGEYQSGIGWVQMDANTIEIYADAPHSGVVEYGSAPHPIEGNPFLIFFWDKVGKTVAMPHVEHPGTTGQFVLSQAADIIWSQCDRITGQILDDVIDP